MELLVTEHSTSLDEKDANYYNNDLQRTHHRTPERLRIRYVPLIKTLERICSESLSNHEVWGAGRKLEQGAPTVILRPWKLFVTYEKEIRNSVREVEALADVARHKERNRETVEKGIFEDRKQPKQAELLKISYVSKRDIPSIF